MEAACNLPELTLIAEYLGDVRTSRQILFDGNDSIMELLCTPSADTSLVIAPQKFSNVGRFFNSINNAEKDAKKKQNMITMRCQIDGKTTVLIYTKKEIKKGE